MRPDLALLSTLTGSNNPCLELIFMVPKVFEPLKFCCSTNLLQKFDWSIWNSRSVSFDYRNTYFSENFYKTKSAGPDSSHFCVSRTLYETAGICGLKHRIRKRILFFPLNVVPFKRVHTMKTNSFRRSGMPLTRRHLLEMSL